MVGTARLASGAATAVRAAFSGATSVGGCRIAHFSPAVRAVTPQRGVTAINSRAPFNRATRVSKRTDRLPSTFHGEKTAPSRSRL
jgi:hypothetical protein